MGLSGGRRHWSFGRPIFYYRPSRRRRWSTITDLTADKGGFAAVTNEQAYVFGVCAVAVWQKRTPAVSEVETEGSGNRGLNDGALVLPALYGEFLRADPPGHAFPVCRG